MPNFYTCIWINDKNNGTRNLQNWTPLPEFKMPNDPTCGNSRRDGFCGEIDDLSFETYPTIGSDDENATVYNYDDFFYTYHSHELENADIYMPLALYLDHAIFDNIN